MPIATVIVTRAFLVPAGEHLDGATLEQPQWLHDGQHTLALEFAQRQAGRLEVASVDGQRTGYDSCCGGQHAPA